MVPRNEIATGIQANEKEDQCRDERCRAKEVDTFEGGSGGVFDGNFDGEAYQGTGDDSQWHSKEVICQQVCSSGTLTLWRNLAS